MKNLENELVITVRCEDFSGSVSSDVYEGVINGVRLPMCVESARYCAANVAEDIAIAVAARLGVSSTQADAICEIANEYLVRMFNIKDK